MKEQRNSPIQISKETFRKTGYQLIDSIAEFLDSLDEKTVTSGESPKQIQQILGDRPLPENGRDASELMAWSTNLMLNHSLFNGHPKFLGYITSSATPIGALGDLLAAAVNPNVGANILSPMATAIEKQTIQWLTEFVGLPNYWGGLLVSGGNMANFTAFLAGRTAKAPHNIKEHGLPHEKNEMIIYCSKATHTWIEKAVTLFGHGTRAMRRLPVDAFNRMDHVALETAIQEDLRAGKKPFLVAATAGDVSTGVVDDFAAISEICKKYDIWLHIDGAYGMPAAVVPEYQYLFKGIQEADSIALDPHKWLYSPLEAGCALVKNPQHLIDTFSSHPEYYNFSQQGEGVPVNFYEYGLQNSRGFRALKVWLSLQQVGRLGYEQMIREDIELAAYLYQLADAHPELQAWTHKLSITTLRYIPKGISPDSTEHNTYLNTLNESLLNQLQQGGEAFLSNAVIDEKYLLRGCVVNFNTSKKDIEEITTIIVEQGRKLHSQLYQKQNTITP